MSVDDVITFLNSLLRIDRSAVTALIGNRVPCNAKMANHPSVQVMLDKDGQNTDVGFLGVLNGMFGSDDEGWGSIAVEFDDDSGQIHQFFKTSVLQRGWGSCL